MRDTLVEINPSGNILNTKQINTFNDSNGVLTVVVDMAITTGCVQRLQDGMRV